MSFFDSEVVRAEISEISDLQEDIYRNVFEFPRMTKEEKLFHVSLLEKLLNKQQILYTRLKLSDDPEAVKMKEKIRESARMMGLPPHVDMNVIFNNMTQLLETMKERIDNTGSDL
jgi:GTPase Era involved in 16S rRNA processing